MLVKLALTDVHEFWPLMKKALRTSGKEEDSSERLLEAMLGERVQCWLIVDGASLIGFVATQMVTREIEGDKSLFIRHYYSLNGVSEELSDDVEDTLLVYAKGRGCSSIVAYADDEKAIAKAVEEGCKKTTLIVKEVD
ncbi:MAG: hypothetical protein ACXABY_09735 [Candidatus Thorarchaeota archaeon]|jgi:hypothetical protein